MGSEGRLHLNHIDAITDSGAPVAVNVQTFGTYETTLNKVSGGFVLSDLSANIIADFSALEGDVTKIQSIAFLDTATPVIDLTAAQASSDASLLTKIVSPYVLNVANSSGSTTTTGFGNDLTIAAAASGPDTITAGGTSETFVFAPSFGHDTITDFYQHLSGTGADKISLPSAEFSNFAAVLADATASGTGGANTTLTSKVTPTDSLTLDGVTTSRLANLSGDFVYHS